ncbi:hypothetical protein WA026_020350 [Henosepilachna vigintioctopunctata]|uniref:Uncharacterized protein n=1 Tax=Henosepilachna vigintioctopunctata TaxID=420089 RepID=A0AAW1TYQ4_9CUCU
MTVALPLSAGRITRFPLLYSCLRERFSDEVKLKGGGLEVRRILAMSCLIFSAWIDGRLEIASSLWQMIVSVGIVLREMTKLKPLERAFVAVLEIVVSE